MEEKMRKNKGITLVALVVTIVAIIIIAGISINLLLGENGILTKAKEAKKAQKVAEVKEKLSLEIAAAETDAIIRDENLEQRQLEDIINKYGTLQDDGDTILTKEDNYELSLKEIWYGVLSTSGSYSDKVEQVEMLEKEVEDLKKKCEQLENLNQENSGLLEDLQGQIENLQKEKQTLENELQEERNKNQELENEKNTLQENLNAKQEEIEKLKNTPSGGSVAFFNATYTNLSKDERIVSIKSYNNSYATASNNILTINTPGTYTAYLTVGHSPYESSYTCKATLYIDNKWANEVAHNYGYAVGTVTTKFTVGSNESKQVKVTIHGDSNRSKPTEFASVVICKET